MAHEKLTGMQCWPLVLERLNKGDYLETIAAWIQEEQEEYTDAQRGSLVRALHRYRTEEIGATKGLRVPTWMQKKLNDLRRGVHEVDELEKLYLLQVERIGIGMELETRLKVTNRHLGKDVAIARDILAKMAELKMDMGVYERAPDELHIKASPSTTLGALETMAPEQRQRITAVASLMLDQLKLAAGSSPAPEAAELAEATIEVLPVPDPNS